MENKKKDDVLSFDDMTAKQKDDFLEKKFVELQEKYSSAIERLKGVETHTIVLQTGEGCILRKPDAGTMRKVMSKMFTMSGESDFAGAGEAILESCWVGGDNIILENDDMRIAAAMQAFQLVQMMQGIIKKN